MNVKKIISIIFMSLLFFSSVTATEKSKLLGRWQNSEFHLDIDKKSITYKDLATKKEIEWEYTINEDQTTSGSFTITKEKSSKIENKAETITPKLYNHLYKNNGPISWKVVENKLYLQTNYGSITLDEDTSLSTGAKIGLGALGVVAAVGGTILAVEVDQHNFSESELISLTNSAVNAANK